MSNQFEFAESKGTRFQEKPRVIEPSDVGLPVGTGLITHRDFQNLELKLGRAKAEVEIPEGIEIPEILSSLADQVIGSSEQNLGPAKGVLDRDFQDPSQKQAKKLVSEDVKEPHRVPFQGINEP